MPPAEKGKEPKVRKKPGRRQTSCAECRRLKLKCDKNVPCEKCKSRGCAEICPEGVLAPSKGNRMVLSGTEELHERIEQLGAHIRELEEALQSLQEQVSDQPHPLLRKDLLRPPSSRPNSHQGSSASTSAESSSAKSPVESCAPNAFKDDTIDAFGTLTVHQDGVSKYIGHTARSEFLISAPIKQETRFQSQDDAYSPFPDFEERTGMSKESVYGRLPPFSQATHLCDVYLRHSKHLYASMPRTELLDDILMPVYRFNSYDSFQVHHATALLFMVFALAAYFDAPQDTYSSDAQEYYQLARTTLGFASPVRQTTVASIQALIHMAQYLDFSDWSSSGSASAWLYIGQAVRLGFSIGLNLNPARWKLPQMDVNRRRRVFWQLFVADTWTSFYFGRPPSISPNYIDCPMPDGSDDPTTVALDDGTALNTDFQAWSYEFTTLMNSVMASGMGPKQPTYCTILDLDRQIREFPVPSVWRVATEREASVSSDVHLHRWAVLANKETTLLNLHRAYFAQALYENPHDLEGHRYIPSIVAIYRSSWRIVTGLEVTWLHAPEMIMRVNLPWSQGLSAAIVMCLLITRAPSSHLVAPAREKLGRLLSLFHSASQTCRSAANLLGSIQRLYNKACEADNPPRYQPSASTSETSISQVELDRLSGKTHLCSESTPMQLHSPSISSQEEKPLPHHHRSSQPSSATFSASASASVEGLHPVLVQDLKDYSKRLTVPSLLTLSDGESRDGSPMTTTTTPTGTASSRSPQPYAQPPHPSHPSAAPPAGRASGTGGAPREPPYYPPAPHQAPSALPSSSAYQYHHHHQYHPPPPAYLPAQISAQHHMLGQGHHPYASSTLIPGPFSDSGASSPASYGYARSPAVSALAVNPDRKYATLTTSMLGVDPTIEMLDPSWQTLVEQLGY